MARARIHVSSLALALLMLPAAADDGFGPDVEEDRRDRLAVRCIPEEQAMAEWDWSFTLDELYDLACEAAGRDLDRAQPRFNRPIPAVGFRVPEGEEPALGYWVDVRTGIVFKVDRVSPYWRPGLMSRERAQAITDAALASYLPDELRDAEWTCWMEEGPYPGHLVVFGQLAGHDPAPLMPRPNFTAIVSGHVGMIWRYYQHLTFDRLDAEPAITYEEALETAEAAVGIGPLDPSQATPLAWELSPNTTYLWHGPQEMYYNIAFVGPDKPGHVRIDALTGEVLEIEFWPVNADGQADPVLTDPPGMIE